MASPQPSGPGLAYVAIMVLAIATAVFLKRRADRWLRLSPVQQWGSRWERSAAR